MSHIYRVWQKWVYSYEYAEQSLFLYYYMLIIVLFPIQTTVNLLLSLPYMLIFIKKMKENVSYSYVLVTENFYFFSL